jgi:N-acetylglucosaminyldiphosphoundecaprenol N-acetyl-beta-D-mannosaminyltransferase
MDDCVSFVQSAMNNTAFGYVVTPNVDHVVKLHRAEDQPWHQAYRQAVKSANLCINDSRILARLAKWSELSLPVVPGSDLTGQLVSHGVAGGARVALIGGSESDAEWLKKNFEGADIIHFIPPMGVLRNPAAQQKIIAFVEANRPGLTLFAIGAPQSEIVAMQIQTRANCGGVGLCIGASVEFLSGAKFRAPRWMQKLGLEWAFRLLSEPKRMWRRYLIDGPQIFAIWQQWKARQPKS